MIIVKEARFSEGDFSSVTGFEEFTWYGQSYIGKVIAKGMGIYDRTRHLWAHYSGPVKVVSVQLGEAIQLGGPEFQINLAGKDIEAFMSKRGKILITMRSGMSVDIY
jgi:hypothetical protein